MCFSCNNCSGKKHMVVFTKKYRKIIMCIITLDVCINRLIVRKSITVGGKKMLNMVSFFNKQM
jgi:hypothetical protein